MYECKRQEVAEDVAKFRGGTTELSVEIGRWSRLNKEGRACRQCAQPGVENEKLGDRPKVCSTGGMHACRQQ